MKELQCPTNENGVCLGIALMAEKARRKGQYHLFKERMMYLEGLEEGTIVSLIDAAHLRLKAHEHLTHEEEILLTVKTFFHQIWSYFKPAAVQQMFSAPGSHYSQQDTRKLEELLCEEQPLDVPDKYLFSVTPNAKGKYSRKHYLIQFLQIIAESNTSLGLIISSSKHATHLFYDKEQKKWYLTNHSKLNEYDSIFVLSSALINAFSKNSIANFAIRVYGEKESIKSRLIHNDEQFFDQILRGTTQNPADSFGATPLLIAAQNNCPDAIRQLLTHSNVDVNKCNVKGITPLYSAAVNGHYEAVQALLEHKNINININNNNPLYAAAQNGHDEIVQALLQHQSIQINQGLGNNPLFIATWNGHMKCVQALLAHLCIESAIDLIYSCLTTATEKGYKEIAQLFLELKDTQGRNLLWYLVAFGQTQRVNILLQNKNVDVNQSDFNGISPLWQTALSGDDTMLRVLLENQAIDVNFSKNGQNTLFIAAQNGNLSCVELLLAHPHILVNSINVTYPWGKDDVGLPKSRQSVSALWIAAAFNRVEVVKSLLQIQEVDVNLTNNGISPLWIAVAKGNIEVVKALLGHPQTDLNQTNRGVSLLQAAIKFGHREVTQVIKSKMNEATLPLQHAIL
jgi:ankyrin repeat protein